MVCAFNHPEVSQSLGPAEEILPKINYNPAHYGQRSVVLPPSVTFHDGVAYKTISLIADSDGGPVEDRRESIDIRDRAPELERAEGLKRLKREAKKVLERASAKLFSSSKKTKHRSADGRKAGSRV